MAAPGQGLLAEVSRNYLQVTREELIDSVAAIVHERWVSKAQVKVLESATAADREAGLPLDVVREGGGDGVPEGEDP